jgi:hypothetical protein
VEAAAVGERHQAQAAQAAVVLEQKTPILVLLELQILAEAEEVLTTMLLVLVEKA